MYTLMMSGGTGKCGSGRKVRNFPAGYLVIPALLVTNAFSEFDQTYVQCTFHSVAKETDCTVLADSTVRVHQFIHAHLGKSFSSEQHEQVE
jgi:choline-glycine betaine transporter